MAKTVNSAEKHKDIQYREAIVTFIDILGFKNMLSNLDANGIYEVLNQFHLQHNKNSLSNHTTEHEKTYETEVYFFSDSVVRIKYTDYEDMWLNTASDEVITLAVMQFELFKRGILIRGGCTKGMIYSNTSSNILFGPALAEAYKIESEFSVYPRIVVSESVLGDCDRDMTMTVHWIKSDFSANRGFDFMEVAKMKYITAGWEKDVTDFISTKRSIVLNKNSFINYFWGRVTSIMRKLLSERSWRQKYIPLLTSELTNTIETYLSLLLNYNNKIENDNINDRIKIKLLWCRFHLHETIKDIYEWVEGYELSNFLDVDLNRRLAEQTELFFKRYGIPSN